MKQSASQEPITQITKAEVEEKRLGEFVIMPSGCDDVTEYNTHEEYVVLSNNSLEQQVGQ